MSAIQVIAESQMTVLLNQLGDAAVVRAPLLGDTPLCRLSLSGRQVGVEQIIASREYATALSEAYAQIENAAAMQNALDPDTLADDLKRELPNYNRLRDVFRQAGVVEPSNLSEIRSRLQEAQQSNPARGGDVYYFAFDNNILRNRLYSLYLKPQQRHAPRYNLLLSQFVRKELEMRAGKIQYDFLHTFNAAYPQVGICAIFQNQNRLNDRLRLLGIAEWNRIRESGDAEVVNAPNKTDADGRIIEAYARFAEKAGRKVVVFSADNEFILRCSGRTNLIGQLVDYPPVLEQSYAVTWESVGRLLYQLAVVYGRIDVEADGVWVRLYGVWRGKKASHWEAEQIKLTFTPSQTVQELAIERNLRILSRMNADSAQDRQ